MIVSIPPDESKEKQLRLNTEEGELEERSSLRPPEKHAEPNDQESDECTKLVVQRAKLLHDRSFLLTQMVTVWLLQFTLLAYIAQDTYLQVDLEFPQAIPSLRITLTRFITGLVMHLALGPKLNQGLQKMKFALNHAWRFDTACLAAAAGFSQIVVIVSVELLMYLIVVLSHDIIEVVTTLLALYIISKFDEVFFTEFAEGETTKQLIKDEKFATLRAICQTSS